LKEGWDRLFQALEKTSRAGLESFNCDLMQAGNPRGSWLCPSFGFSKNLSWFAAWFAVVIVVWLGAG
jgi:hypothetical protein